MTLRHGWVLSAFAVLAVAPTMAAAFPPDVIKTMRTDCFGDPLPDGALTRMGTVRFRHGAGVQFVSYLSDGKTILSIGNDDFLRWWEAASGKEIRRQPIGASLRDCVSLSLDRKTATARVGDDVYIWDVLTGKELRKLEAPDDFLTTTALSADGKLLLICGSHMRLWDAATGARLRNFDNGGKAIASVVFSPDGATLISAAHNGTVQWWDLATGKAVAEDTKQDECRHITLSADGKHLAIYCRERALKLWDAGTRMELYALPPSHDGENVSCLAFSPDGKQLATGAEDGVIRLVDGDGGKEAWRCQSHQGMVMALSFSPNGETLVSSGEESAVRQWDVASGKEIRPFAGSHSQVLALAVSPDGGMVASGGNDRGVHLWNAITGKERRSLTGCDGEDVKLLGFSPDGKTLSCVSSSSNNGNAVHLWNATEGKLLHSFSLADKGYAGRCALTPDGAIVAAFDGLYRIALFDAAKGETLQEHSDKGIKAIELGAFIGGKSLAAILLGRGPNSRPDAFLLWDVESGTRVSQPLRSDLGGVCKCVGSPDGNTLALVSAEGRISLWNVSRGDPIRTWNASKDFILGVAFSADGRTVATSDLDGSVSLWEAATGMRRGVFRGGQGFIDALVFSLDGRRLYSGGHDGTVLAWDLTSQSPGVESSTSGQDEKTLDRLWNDLGSGDAVLAYRTVWKLSEMPERSVPFLSAHLRHPAATPALIARWIADLDSDNFEARERASTELRSAEEMAEPSLTAAMAAHPMPEARRRIEELLEWLKKVRREGHPPEVRLVRAIEALEAIHTAPARETLAQLAEGPETSLTREAKTSLERLHQRPSSKP